MALNAAGLSQLDVSHSIAVDTAFITIFNMFFHAQVELSQNLPAHTQMLEEYLFE